MRYILAAALLATPAAADYKDHSGVTLFTGGPCTEAVGTIDGSTARDGLDATVRNIAAAGMAWGFLLGYDTALGGLSGEYETTLIRLRIACAASPETPATDLLRGFK